MNTNHGKLWLAALALLVILGLQARATTITATLDPAQISVGESAQLTVTVSGTDDQEAIPSVNGLEITNVEHSNFMNIINGSMSSSTSNIYSVTPQREGTFTIPAIHAGSAASQPITLRVGKGAASAAPAPTQASPSPAPSNGPVVLPPPSVNASPAAEPAATDKFGSVEITIPQKEFYDGELVPIVIKVFIPQDVQPNLNDLPQFASDGFTLNPLSTKLDQNAEAINGRVYDVLTWHSALTAVKTGEYPISLKVPLTVVEFQRMPQPANADDMFNNFFRNFATMGRRRDVTLSNKPETLKVLPLPQANRPADFGGAVGQFEVEAGATPVKVNAGDPITLQLKISGTGNFDRVSSAMLAANPEWKTYSTKNQFEGTDSVGYQGTKTFEQPVIPSDSSVKAIPSLSFSYFDPETRQYVTRATAPIAVSVTGGVAAPIASVAPPVATSPNQSPAPTPPTPASDLRPNQIEAGVFASTLSPVYLNPLFVAGQGLPLLALLSGLLLLRSRRQAAQPARIQSAAIQRAIREQVAAMDEAMRNHQSGAFFIHARTALQQRLGQRWNLRPETITVADVEARLGEAGVNIRPVFEMADQASYSDLNFEDSDLQQWRQAVMNELAEKN